jgi:hypothetical protein
MQSVIVPMCQKGGTLRQQRERGTEPDHVLYGRFVDIEQEIGWNLEDI